jgi:lysophospholipase L1-like esterase
MTPPKDRPVALSRRHTLVGAGLLAAVAGSAAAQPAQPPSTAPTAPTGPSQTDLDAAEVRLRNDWAYLARYRDQNPIDAARPAQQRRVVFLGDSITLAWPARRPAFFTDNGFLGRGISGQTTPQMLVRFMADVAALKPAAVHLMAATNDVAGNTGPYDPKLTCDTFTAIGDLAKANRIRMIVGAVPPTAEFPWRRDLAPGPRIQALNAWLRDWAKARGFVFADYTSVLDDGTGAMRPGLAYDGVHPTPAGYDAMIPVALAAVKTALGRR